MCNVFSISLIKKGIILGGYYVEKNFYYFAIEDAFYRNGLVNHAKDERTPFEFVDMSVKQSWEDSWKTRCRTKIKGCDGVIALISKNTMNASGARWEIKCADEESIPMIGIHIHKTDRGTIPELAGYKVVDWTWDNITSFLNSL